MDGQVVCLRCRHESERYENIMDLTLEIFGWVESLEDALTQFTTPEDLDGENMYRCGRFVNFSSLLVLMLFIMLLLWIKLSINTHLHQKVRFLCSGQKAVEHR